MKFQLPSWVEPMVYFKSQHITDEKTNFVMLGVGNSTKILPMFKAEPMDKSR